MSAAIVAAGAANQGIGGWVTGYVLTVIVVVVVVALVVPILLFARDIGKEAKLIDESLEQAVRNTAALSQLNTTIDHAQVIVAGLNRGRKRLGG